MCFHFIKIQMNIILIMNISQNIILHGRVPSSSSLDLNKYKISDNSLIILLFYRIDIIYFSRTLSAATISRSERVDMGELTLYDMISSLFGNSLKCYLMSIRQLLDVTLCGSQAAT